MTHTISKSATIKLNCHTLLVEDSPSQQRLTAQALINAGAEVTLECNSQAAVDRIARTIEQGCPFHIVVLDLRMPIVDGFASTKSMRLLGFDRPIIGIASQAIGGLSDMWLEAGCDRVLTKPINLDEFPRSVAELLRPRTSFRRFSDSNR